MDSIKDCVFVFEGEAQYIEFDMEFDHLGCLDSCKQVMARWMELVACLLNQRLVQSEESTKRNAYTSNSIATDRNRKVKTRSVFEYLC